METLKMKRKNIKLDTAEEKIHELEDRSIEITQNEAQREKRLEKNIRASMTMGLYCTIRLTLMYLESLRRKKREYGRKIIEDHFQNLIKNKLNKPQLTLHTHP